MAETTPTPWDQYEDLRSRYASACERMGMAHANGTRAEWEDAARSEVERRLALNECVRALSPGPGSDARPDRTAEGKVVGADTSEYEGYEGQIQIMVGVPRPPFPVQLGVPVRLTWPASSRTDPKENDHE